MPVKEVETFYEPSELFLRTVKLARKVFQRFSSIDFDRLSIQISNGDFVCIRRDLMSIVNLVRRHGKTTAISIGGCSSSDREIGILIYDAMAPNSLPQSSISS